MFALVCRNLIPLGLEFQLSLPKMLLRMLLLQILLKTQEEGAIKNWKREMIMTSIFD